MEERGPGLLGLPDIAHAAVAGYCDQTGHIMLMSTSSVARETFSPSLVELEVRACWLDEAASDHVLQTALSGLLHRLPNLQRLKCHGLDGRSAQALSHVITAFGDCCRGLVALEIREYRGDSQGGRALGSAIGTGNLPALQILRASSGEVRLEEDLTDGLVGGASPRLTDVEFTCSYGGLVALAEALEARITLGCCHITHLNVKFDEYEDYDWTDDAGHPLRRACASSALALLKTLRISELFIDEEVCFCIQHSLVVR
jgi:hypothetical protein